MKKLIIIAVLSGLAIFALSARAHSPRPRKGRGPDRQTQVRQTEPPRMMCRGGWSGHQARQEEMKRNGGCPHWYGWLMPWHGSRCSYRNGRGHRGQSSHGPRRGHHGC